jgi:phage-related protein
MKYEVIILEPAKVFLHNINIKLRAKAFRTIELLQEFGPLLKEPHSKKVTGIKDLFELRVKFSSNICRLFYFHYKNTIYVITSGYVKKEQKLNKLEIEKALKLMKQYKEE